MKTMFYYTLKRLLFQIIGWGVGLAFYCALVIGFFHIALENAAEIQKLLGSLPRALTSLAGDLSTFTTPEGYLRIRIFGIFPLILGAFGIIVGSGLIIQDEESGRLDLFMGYPISRAEMFSGRFLALIAALISILSIIWIGIIIGAAYSVMQLNWLDIFPALVSLLAIVLFFTSLGLMLSLYLSSRMAAAITTGLIMLISQVISNLAELSHLLKPFALFSPFQYYQSINATKGFSFTDFFLLISVSSIFIFIAYQRFNKRDIRVAGEGELNWKKFSVVVATTMVLFMVLIFSVTKDRSFASPQNCFATVQKSFTEKNWNKLVKSLTPEAVDQWSGELVLRGGIFMLDVGDDGFIRILQNNINQFDPEANPAISQEQLMASLFQLQLAIANVDFSLFSKKIFTIAKYTQTLHITEEEIKDLASIVKDKKTFLTAILKGLSDAREFITYSQMNNLEVTESSATAQATTTTDDKVNISFRKTKDTWQVNIPFPEITEERILKESKEEDFGDYQIYHNITFDEKNSLQLDAYIPGSSQAIPAFVIVHGGSWRLGDKTQLASYAHLLANKGYACFAINYRLAPKHKFPAQIEDCQNALRWIRENSDKYNIDPQQIAAVGYSAGAHLVTLMATMGKQQENTQLKFAIAGGTPSNFSNLKHEVRQFSFLLGATPQEKPKAYQKASPQHYLSESTCPIFFFHGEEDAIVSIDGPLSPIPFYESLLELGIPSKLNRIHTVGHLEGAYHKEAIDFIVEVVEENMQ